MLYNSFFISITDPSTCIRALGYGKYIAGDFQVGAFLASIECTPAVNTHTCSALWLVGHTTCMYFKASGLSKGLLGACLCQTPNLKHWVP